MRRLVLVVLLLAVSSTAFAIGPKVLRGIGLTVGRSAWPNFILYDNQFNWPVLERDNTNATLLALHYVVRTNLFSMNDENSVAIDLRPTVGVALGKSKKAMFSSGELLNFPLLLRMPIMLEWNHGLLSTVMTNKSYGFGLGLGMNYQFMYDADYHNYDKEYYSSPEYTIFAGNYQLWQPAINLAFRHWSWANICTEYNLNFGFAEETFLGKKHNRNTITLSVSAYFNY